MIAERGVAGTRLADVAERIGVSPPAVLYWFDSKEQLLAEALVADEDRYYNALGVRLAELERSRRAPLAADLLGRGIGAGEFALWLELWAWSLRDAGLSEARERLDHRWRGEIEKIVRDGQVSGVFGGRRPPRGGARDRLAARRPHGPGPPRRQPPPEQMVEVAVLVAERLLECELPRPPLLSVEEMLAGAEAWGPESALGRDDLAPPAAEGGGGRRRRALRAPRSSPPARTPPSPAASRRTRHRGACRWRGPTTR